MRIIHLTSIDSGGAGRACLRLHQALLDSGVDSIVLTGEKSCDIPNVRRVAQTKFQKFMQKVIRPHLSTLPLMLYPKRHKDIFSPNLPFFTPRNRALVDMVNALKPDIVHLHWIQNGFINTKDLESIKAPMIWSLHDANPYTGGCHYVAAACIGVGTHCKFCPLLQSHCRFDISFFTFRRKMRTYKKLTNLTINGLSRWIAQCAKDSALFKDKPIINLPNPINTQTYAPIEKHIARTLLHLTQPKKLIAFGAIGGTSIDRKGFKELTIALQCLDDSLKAKCELVVFGARYDKASQTESKKESIEGITTHFVGHLNDDIALSLLYSAADVMVVPSHFESFGQTALESLCCGTPVVSFDTSGLKDIVRHKHNGYLAQCYEPKDLASGIEWVLNLDSSAYETLSHNARQSAIENFNSKKVASQYIQTYKNLLGGGANKALAKLFILQTLHFQNKKLIGFGAIGGTSVERKGFKELTIALQCLDDSLKAKCEIIIFGGYTEPLDTITTHNLGFIHDDNTLSLAYNACDVFVTPSLAENLSNAIMESLSCGTPVVGFDIGGNADMITHKYNGYLATQGDSLDLASGIEWVLNLDSSAYTTLSLHARQSAIENFSSKKVAMQYIQAYKKIYKSQMGGGIDNTLSFSIPDLSPHL